GAMDFDDLLFKTNVLLRDFPAVLHKYQHKFKYLMVDEYQDTNFSQYVIVKQLAARHENLCVVGDDAQSIYSFRGANIQNILNFEKDYPDVKKLFLEQNYRSTQNIVNAANSIIKNNTGQFKKNVWTHNSEGEKIRVFCSATDMEEGYKVASSIYNIKMNTQLPHAAFAILYRTNAQSRSFEEGLRKLNIPYRIYGGTSFYQRKEIKDVLAYFRLAINPQDDQSMHRIINYPARGIGDTTIDKISVLASDNNVSIFTVIDNLHDFNPDINAGTVSKLKDFVAMIKSFGILVKQQDAYETANNIINSTGILRDLNKEKTPEDISRVENVEELLSAVKGFIETERTPQEEELKQDITNSPSLEESGGEVNLFDQQPTDTGLKTIDEFMQEIALLTDADKNKDDENADKISLMTVHASKGLEFPYVYIVGMEENLFPSQMALQDKSDLEEERRLFYVAITRAEKQAILSYAQRRFRYGNHIFCEPSRFMDEIDPQYLDLLDVPDSPNPSKGGEFYAQSSPYRGDKRGASVNLIKPKQASPTLKRNLISTQNINTQAAPIDAQVIKSIKEGTIVQHDKFGKGAVLALEGDFPNIKATIQFDLGGQKQLLLKYAKLKVL
ncbi:MAG TPA: 3'-5' exonuclease, partial [Bacteroidia bacterium]